MEPIVTELIVPENIEAVRLDKYLADLPSLSLSRNRIQHLIRTNQILVNHEEAPTKLQLHGGEKIEVRVPEPEPTKIIPEDLPIEILYQDESLAVVNKPAGMVTHPATGNKSGTLVNALLHHLGPLATTGARNRPGIVHRLDKNTSGLLVVARDEEVHGLLQTAIQNREVARTYLGIVCGHMPRESDVIDLPLGRSVQDRRKVVVVRQGGRDSTTEYRLVERYRSYELLSLSLGTGRTHQIRVHLAHLGHPVLGDPEYGGRESWHRGLFGPERPLGNRLLSQLNRQALHAHKLEFVHPISKEKLEFISEVPEDMQTVLNMLRTEGS